MAQIAKICNGLRKYYASLGKGAEYVNANGVGKFTAYCEDNGIDDDEAENLGDDPEQCLLVDFDDDFPVPKDKESMEEQEKKKYIFEILLQCHDGVDFNAISYDQASFDAVNDADIESIKKIYKKYCPAVFNRDMGDDGGLLFMLAFQKKYGVDYLANLLDSFTRYRIEYQQDIAEKQWAMLADNVHFRKRPLSKIKFKIPGSKPKDGKKDAAVSYEDFATSAMFSFNKRCCGKLMFGNTPTLIDDSLDKIASYISGAAHFVSNMITTNTGGVLVTPFQFDVAIAVGKPQATTDDEEEDDDDEDEDDEKSFAQDGGPGTGQYLDWVQEIEPKLKANSLKYTRVDQANADEDRRRFGNLFKQFIAKNDIKEVDDAKKHYLANKRLIAFIDRRTSKKKDDVNDDIFMYEPPPGGYTRDIPSGADFMTDWFLSASRTSLLPNDGYDAELVVGNSHTKDTDDNSSTIMNKPGMNIGAADHCSGAVITLSFWVYSADKIKLYLYWNGGMIRVLPRDIKLLLPKIFVDNEENKKYVDGDALKQLIEDLETKLVDKEFESWMETYKVSN